MRPVIINPGGKFYDFIDGNYLDDKLNQIIRHSKIKNITK